MGFLTFIGFLLPAAIDLINVRIADTRLRFWVSVLFCSAIGTVVYFVQTGGVFTGADDLFAQIMAMIGEAQVSYKAAWGDSTVRTVLGLNATVAQGEMQR